MPKKIQSFDSRQIMNRSDYEIFHYKEPAQSKVSIHSHDFYEIFFLLNGNISYWIEGEVYHPKDGEIILIPPMTLHRPLIPDDKTSYERIVLWIDKNYLDSISTEEIRLAGCFENAASHLLHPDHAQRAGLTENFSCLVNEYYSDEYGAEIYADSLFKQIMVELNRIRQNSSAPHKAEHSSPLVSGIAEYIGEHFAENISLDSLAEEFYVSKYHLSHEFSSCVGISVYRYIMLKRLSAAKLMLMNNAAPGEVYLKCGFKDYTAFFRAFKAEYGISPRDFSAKL